MSTNPSIDWTDPSCQITDHFTVSDLCMLHAWGRLANESDGLDDGAKVKLITLAEKAEQVRDILGVPMNSHCGFRSDKYNIAQGILLPTGHDVHWMCLAMDFDCNGSMTIDEVHAKLLPHLEDLGIRMEQNTPTWVHFDLHPVGNARYFKA